MSEHRPIVSYKTLTEIIEALCPDKIGNDGTYVGKNYNKEQLIKDLQRIDGESDNELEFYLLSHEQDIAIGINDFDNLRGVFKRVTGNDANE